MRYLVSLPENSIDSFHQLSGKLEDEWYCISDPSGKKVGSGGGTAWLLSEVWKNQKSSLSFSEWLHDEKRILIHGGGQSRRLPAYASMGKLLLPIPVYRWERGQRLNQTLLDLQLPLFEKLIDAAPSSSHTLLASGDALILSDASFSNLPDSDIISFGLSVDPSLASRHGVFICPREKSQVLEYMLQKPSTSTLRELAVDYLCYIDVGIWILSDKAVQVLMKKCGWDENQSSYDDEVPSLYDFYGTFGPALGETPKVVDPDIAGLTTSIINLPEGEFYHFGTSREIISSSLDLQNKICDQKAIWTRNVKPHPAMFVQNSLVDISLTEKNADLWIENSHIGDRWTLGGNQILSGIPANDWSLSIPEGLCLDIAPIRSKKFVIRPYGMNDPFRGALGDPDTQWLSSSFTNWLEDRGLSLDDLDFDSDQDIQEAALFPLLSFDESIEIIIQWMLDGSVDGKDLWLKSKRLSATEISENTDLTALEKQRTKFRSQNWSQLGKNYSRSVFFQVDLDHAAQEFSQNNISLPEPLKERNDPLLRCHDQMFRSRAYRYRGESSEECRDNAFRILRQSILEPIVKNKVFPIKNVYEDQIIWSRSPVRIDLAGGWTDTPPFCVLSGGKVVNISLELNGQPPLQAFIRPSKERVITMSSIDLGQRKIVSTYDELSEYYQVGSPFAIPKAALCLAGFHPSFSGQKFSNLKTQLEEFGSGIEISFLAAIPKGSGMGTSSNLAATILGGLSDFCNLGWDSIEICNRTLGLEQLLTTGGGWQDQYGGAIPGVKFLETMSGWDQSPRIRWLPEHLFTTPEYHSSMLLYYTGITRIAKNLLSEIVEGMFLNERDRSFVLREIKQHAIDTWETIQQGNYSAFGEKIARSWKLNKQLDEDTSNPEIESIVSKIEDLAIGFKLPGAGGGGYLYICAKNTEAAQLIEKRLNESPPNPRARFVDMKISTTGLEVTRS